MYYCCLYSWEGFFFFFGSWCGRNRLLGSSESLILLFWVNPDDLDTAGLSSHLSIWGTSITPVRKRKSWRLTMFVSQNLFSICASPEVCGILDLGLYLSWRCFSLTLCGCVHTDFFLSVMYEHHFEGVITVALPALPSFYILYILSVVAFSQLLQ